ncbi:hypothetical protein [Acinetobacter pittii]|uniref:hypothetical protein n=1 Tax=Acinetobacter pittii TaxID=48296 RepID=UPI000A37518A|nr:hypothetical protein [Acinetobacter pittii]OTU22145.1 hypothetical protein CAT62_06125 [Acinetobacter pittii]
MTDLNKERELYEVWAFNNIENFIDVERDGMYYVMKQGSRLKHRDKEFLVLSSNRGWAAWQEKAKDQAVPEGYVVISEEAIEKKDRRIEELEYSLKAIYHRAESTYCSACRFAEGEAVDVGCGIKASESGAEG